MKKALFIALFGMISLISQAQLVATVTESYRNGFLETKTRSLYRYDIYGNLIQADSSNWYRHKWTDCCQHTYVYDEKGRRVEWVTINLGTLPWEIDRRATWSYSQDDRLSIETVQTRDSKDWQNSYQTIRVRDTSGRMIRSSRNYWWEEYWRNEQLTLTKWDDFVSDTLSVSTVFVRGGGLWNLSFRTTNERTHSGLKTIITKEKWHDSTWVAQSRHTYNAAQFGSSFDIYEVWQNQSWSPSRRNYAVIDDNGNVTSSILEEWSDSGWRPVQITSNTYSRSTVIEEVPIPNGFAMEVFPNPARESIQLKLEGARTEDAVVEIFDTLGRLNYTSAIRLDSRVSSYLHIDIGDLHLGLFHVRVRDGNQSLTKSFVKY